jgi:hypothetical protein
MLRFRHLHPCSTPESQCRIKKTINNFLFLVELLNLIIERELLAGGTQMSNSLHESSLMRDDPVD